MEEKKPHVVIKRVSTYEYVHVNLGWGASEQFDFNEIWNFIGVIDSWNAMLSGIGMARWEFN